MSSQERKRRVVVCVFLTARLGIWPEALNTFWGNSVMFEFLLGVAAYKIAEPEPLMHRKLIAAAVIAVGATACAAIAGLFTSERLFFAGVPALILFILLLNMPAGLNRKSSDIMFWLVLIGDASYALYLSHPFIMVIVKKTLFTLHLDAIGLPILSLCYIVNTLILACVCAIAYHLLIEKPLTSYLQSMLRFRGFGRRWRPIRPAPE
jgi:peptidoglycan/LPS O-acetylase OafA/YrhL